MSYQVLARKYRPRTFEQMAGQEHVLRALINALNQGRLHHAYLFTGTRGVGKTSIARLLAKCLNCEVGVSANPCGVCTSCQEVDAGRFVDLIEVDAASRTKVEDTRELLENVQYAPTRGRYKVYLIDEVHMLSGHSFNALLKTLEEPPQHVKFLLATTDPQRLPVTVLSRCLQFNLKNLPASRIETHLAHVLTQEQLAFEPAALTHLAHAATGSLRDALSLLDQAISYSGDQLRETDVRTMLGSIEQTHIFRILDALVENNAQALITVIAQLAEQAADFSNALEELLSILHKIALGQAVPDIFNSDDLTERAQLQKFAQQISREDIQLYYQIAAIGRRDLPLAPSPRSGFEMIMLRMLAFRPTDKPQAQIQNRQEAPAPVAAGKSVSPVEQKPAPASTPIALSTSTWETLIAQLNLTGFTMALATNCILKEHSNDIVHLELDPAQAAMRNPKQEARLAEALTAYFNKPTKVQINLGNAALSTPARVKQTQHSEHLAAATQALHQDPNMQTILKAFDAQIAPDSIQAKSPDMLDKLKTPIEENQP